MNGIVLATQDCVHWNASRGDAPLIRRFSEALLEHDQQGYRSVVVGAGVLVAQKSGLGSGLNPEITALAGQFRPWSPCRTLRYSYLRGDSWLALGTVPCTGAAQGPHGEGGIDDEDGGRPAAAGDAPIGRLFFFGGGKRIEIFAVRAIQPFQRVESGAIRASLAATSCNSPVRPSIFLPSGYLRTVALPLKLEAKVESEDSSNSCASLPNQTTIG